MFCLQVMVEVCAERIVVPQSSCVTLYIDDCESRWEGEGDSRVWVKLKSHKIFVKYPTAGHHPWLLCQATSPAV